MLAAATARRAGMPFDAVVTPFDSRRLRKARVLRTCASDAVRLHAYHVLYESARFTRCHYAPLLCAFRCHARDALPCRAAGLRDEIRVMSFITRRLRSAFLMPPYAALSPIDVLLHATRLMLDVVYVFAHARLTTAQRMPAPNACYT